MTTHDKNHKTIRCGDVILTGVGILIVEAIHIDGMIDAGGAEFHPNQIEKHEHQPK